VCMLMPKGARSWAWFTTHGDAPACYLLETDDPKSIRVVDASFATPLSYGTLLQGTYFRSHTKRPFFVVDDVIWYKGKNVIHTTYESRLEIILELLRDDVGLPINDYMVSFGVPTMAASVDALLKLTCPYPIDRIVYRYLDTNRKIFAQPWSADIHKTIPGLAPTREKQATSVPSVTRTLCPREKRRYFWVTADPSPDVYNLYDDKTGAFIDTACVQKYESSVALNVLFRHAKADAHLDALEESDDEDEFEQEAQPLDKRLRVECVWVPRFKGWAPNLEPSIG
jgi:hypothetical protein